MKSIAIFVATSLLLEILAPTLLHAAQHPQGTETEGNTRSETADVAVTGYHSKNNPQSEREKEVGTAEQAVQMSYGKGVTVMSRGEIDPSKLRKGWYAYVVYTPIGVKETVIGDIFSKDADGIVIRKSRNRPWERWEIAYGNIDILAVAKARRDIERWRRWFEEKGLRAKLEGELDLSRLSANLPLLEGQRIRIHTRDTEKRIGGRFHQATRDTLILMKWRGVLKQKKQFVPIAATNISKFEVYQYRKSYVKHGAIIGALAGLFISLSLIESDKDSHLPGSAGLIVVGPPLLTIMGSLCGVMVSSVFSHDVWDVIIQSAWHADKV